MISVLRVRAVKLLSKLLLPVAVVRFHHIDYLFLNAGIMPGTTVNWGSFWQQLFSL